jgi:hypothetical protein
VRDVLCILASIVFIWFAKSNSKLLILPMLFVPFSNFKQLKMIGKVQNAIFNTIRKFKWISAAAAVLITCAAYWYLARKFGNGVHYATNELLNTFVFYNSSTNVPGNITMPYLINNIIDGGLWDANSVMPSWWVLIWYVLFALVLLVQKKVEWPALKYLTPLGIAGAGIFFVNYIGVIFKFINYNRELTPYIIGPQGRYYTPFLILFAMSVMGMKYRINLKTSTIEKIAVVFAPLSLILYLVIIYYEVLFKIF